MSVWRRTNKLVEEKKGTKWQRYPTIIPYTFCRRRFGPYEYASPAESSSAIVELKSSYVLRSGERPDGPKGTYDGTYVEDYQYADDSGDLDQCNGRIGVTPEYPNGTYYYVATLDWPYLGRYFRGRIAKSFISKSGIGGSRPRPPRDRPRPPMGAEN